MATLAIVTSQMRIWLRYAAIGLVILTIFFLIIRGLIFVKDLLFPPRPEPPKQEFGKLVRNFSNSPEVAGLNFRINTVNGTLPVIPNKIDVYKLKQFQPDLLALERAKNTVNRQFIRSEPVKISETIYEWSQPEKSTNLQYDIVTGNFSVSSNYLDNPNLLSTSVMPSVDNIKKSVEGYIDSYGADTSDLDFEGSTVTYLELRDRSLVNAVNLGSANFARVDVKQNMVGETPIVYANPNDSIISFVVSYPSQSFTVVEGQYFHYLPLLEEKSDYPIKSAEQAFEDLKKGNAKIFNPNNLSNIDITDIHLKYYLNKNTNEYLQPIIVFSGIDFTAYVDALPDESLQ